MLLKCCVVEVLCCCSSSRQFPEFVTELYSLLLSVSVCLCVCAMTGYVYGPKSSRPETRHRHQDDTALHTLMQSCMLKPARHNIMQVHERHPSRQAACTLKPVPCTGCGGTNENRLGTLPYRLQLFGCDMPVETCSVYRLQWDQREPSGNVTVRATIVRSKKEGEGPEGGVS